MRALVFQRKHNQKKPVTKEKIQVVLNRQILHFESIGNIPSPDSIEKGLVFLEMLLSGYRRIKSPICGPAARAYYVETAI